MQMSKAQLEAVAVPLRKARHEADRLLREMPSAYPVSTPGSCLVCADWGEVCSKLAKAIDAMREFRRDWPELLED